MKKPLSASAALAAATVSLGASLCLPVVASAEEIRIPLGQQGNSAAVIKPVTGSSETQVLGDFGSPIGRSAPVGDPPITRWEYAQFFVYFEYDRVIHAVVKP